jgi:hypothetical protein
MALSAWMITTDINCYFLSHMIMTIIILDDNNWYQLLFSHMIMSIIISDDNNWYQLLFSHVYDNGYYHLGL